jgi:hypothetical protein
MIDVAVINLADATVVEKHARGRPRGSKNKPKTSVVASLLATPAKHRRGRPLGSKNKKTSAAMANTIVHLDISLAQPIPPQSSVENLFSFFSFVGTQCHEQQRLPLKFVKFMDGWELHEAIL